MIINRGMIVFIPLVLTLIITVLTAPVPDNQTVTETNSDETIVTTEAIAYEDDKNESSEAASGQEEEEEDEDIETTSNKYIEETSIISEVVSSVILFNDTTAVHLDIHENIETNSSTETPPTAQIHPPDTVADDETI